MRSSLWGQCKGFFSVCQRLKIMLTFFWFTVSLFNMIRRKHTDYNRTVGNYIDFRLDGKWDGEGNITQIFQQNEGGEMVDYEYSVKLLRPCKEHSEGTEIIVRVDELI